MSTITGNARNDAEQRLDSINHHLAKLRELVVSEELGLDQRPDESPAEECAREHTADEDAVVETFGRWVLDLIGLGAAEPAMAVRLARGQLVGALSKRAGQSSVVSERPAGDDRGFVDVFAGDDLVDDPDDELGVKPISYEA